MVVLGFLELPFIVVDVADVVVDVELVLAVSDLPGVLQRLFEEYERLVV